MYYPINLDVRGKRCLVVGGGKVAFQKVKGLLSAGVRPTVIAPQISKGLKTLSAGRRIVWVRRHFKATFLKNYFLVIAATDDCVHNANIGALCRKKQLLVNVVDQPADCNFTVPSLLRRGPLTIAISTNGASPALSKGIRKELEKRYGAEFGTFLELMAQTRQKAIQRIPRPGVRKARFEKAVRSEALSLLKKGKRAQAKRRIETILFGRSW